MAIALGSGTTEEFILSEFESLDLKDKRLDTRAKKVLIALQKNLTTCVRRLYPDQKNVRQTYDLFSNSKVSGAAMIQPHYKKTIERAHASDAEYLLMIQDGMRLNYTSHKAKTEIGRIGKTNKTDQYGLIQHSVLCVTDKNEPLGLLDIDYFHYDEFDSKFHRHHRPIEEKATRCWIDAAQRVRHRLGKVNKPTITVADREGDFFEFIEDISSANELYVIRAKHNRYTGEKHRGRDKKLFDLLDQTPDVGTMTTTICDQHTHEFKEITLNIKVLKNVRIPPPNNGKEEKNINDYEAITLNVVMAYDGKHEWILLRNLSVDTQAQIEKVIVIYKSRWHIEDFHKVEKTGYQVDELYLHSSKQAIETALIMAAISACRLYWLIYVGRVENTLQVSNLFAEHEWKSVYVYLNEPIPKEIPFLSEVILKIACLGGYKPRKGASPPGIKTMWIGFQKFSVASVMYHNMSRKT